MAKIKRLPETYIRKGFKYDLVVREKAVIMKNGKSVRIDAAIYRQSCPSTPSHPVYYEVFEVLRHEGFNVCGRFVEPAEYVPSDEQWGSTGWTTISIEKAKRIFREILRGKRGSAVEGED